MILLPTATLTGLAPAELELILAHELAHLRRGDLWMQLVQRLAEAVLFYNPALWYLTRRASTLREECCDDAVCNTAACGLAGEPTEESRLTYATALVRVVELVNPRLATQAAAVTLAATGHGPSELRRRIARLVGEPVREPVRVSRGGLALIAAAPLLAVALPKWSTHAEEPTPPKKPRLQILESQVCGDEKFKDGRVVQWRPAPNQTEKLWLPHPAESVFTEADVFIADVEPDEYQAGHYRVAITVNSQAGERMRVMSAEMLSRYVSGQNPKERLAILIDGEIVMAPRISSLLSTQFVISGLKSEAEAKRIVKAIQPGGASNSRPTTVAIDLDILQGEWRVEYYEANGLPLSAIADLGFGDMLATFAGEKLSIKSPKMPTSKYSFTLSSENQPKQIDLVLLNPPAPLKAGQTLAGIYEFIGDKLRICLHDEPDKQRPTEFTAPAGSKRSVMLLQRVELTDQPPPEIESAIKPASLGQYEVHNATMTPAELGAKKLELDGLFQGVNPFPNNLTWGTEKNGLIAAIELLPPRDGRGNPTDPAGVLLGAKLGVVVHVKNVSDHLITFTSETHRQGDWLKVLDLTGAEVPIKRTRYSGWPTDLRWNLKPGEFSKLDHPGPSARNH